MNEVNKELFAKIPTELFYTIEDNKSTKDNSILTNIGDDKVLLILYYLYTSSNYMNESNVSVTYLVDKCNYYNNDKVKKEFKNILNELHKLKYITINSDINNLKHNDLFIVNTSNIMNLNSFVVLEQEELKTLTLNSTNKKELLNLLKVYLYLKCRCYKKFKGDNTAKDGGKAQVTYCSYKNIAEYTYTSEGHIIEYITKLKNLNMIDYNNLGKKYHKDDIKKNISDCNNVYIIKNISNGEVGEYELAEGLKQQRHYYEDNGYIIIKTNTVNDKSIYGRKGYLTKKINNNTITDKELKELELLNSDIEKYKLKYKNKHK